MTQNPRPSAPGRAERASDTARRQGKPRGLSLALVGSVLVHMGIVLVFLPPNFSDLVLPEPRKEEKPFEVRTFVEEAEPPEPVVAQNLPVELRDAPDVEVVIEEEEPEKEAPKEIEKVEPELEPKPEPEPEPEPEPAPQPLPQPEPNKKLVQQENNEEEAVESDFLAEKANRVEEETRARETTELDVLAGKTVPEDLKELTGSDEESRADVPEAEQEQIAEAEEVPAGEKVEEVAPQPLPEPEIAELPPEQEAAAQTSPEKSESGEAPAVEAAEVAPEISKASPEIAGAKQAYKPPPRALFQPTQKDYDAIFAEADKRAASTVNQQKKGRRLLKGWKEREAAMRASLENVNVEVRPGNHTGVNASAAVYATFIARIHRKLHPRWGRGYLPRLDSDYGPGDPLSNPKLEVTLEYILDAASGAVEAVNIVRTSGEMMFDAEAVVIFNEIAPHRGAPKEIISPDGKIYIHWTLWRNQQQCGPWGASIFLVDNGTKKRIDRGGKAGGDASQSGGR